MSGNVASSVDQFCDDKREENEQQRRNVDGLMVMGGKEG